MGHDGAALVLSFAMSHRPFFAALVATMTFVATAPAHAQDDDVDASALVREGAQLARHGEFRRAEEVLRQAVAAGRTGRALAELGFVEQALGRAIEAEQLLAEAELLTEERWVRRHARDIARALTSVRALITTLTVTANVEGAEVRINGTLAGRTPMREPARIAVGTSEVEVRAAGYTPITRQVTALATEPAELSVTLERNTPPPAPEAPPPPRCAQGLVLRNGLCFAPEPDEDAPPSTWRWMIYAGGAATLLTAGLAIGLWADGNGTESAYLARCGAPMAPAQCRADQLTTQAELDSRATVVNTMWALSAVAAITTVVGVGMEMRTSRRRPSMPVPALSFVPNGVRLTW